MKSTLSGKRKGDALITLRQNNLDRKIEVVRMNRAAESLTGYSSGELVGNNINKIIPKRISESLEEYMDFDNQDNDFASVVRRIPNFQIINKQGSSTTVSLKVFHLVSEVVDNPEYEILMRDISLLRKMEELRAKLIESGTGRGVSTSDEVKAVYDIVYNFVEKESVEVTYAVAAIDNFDTYLRNYSTNTIDSLIDKVAIEIVNTCRDDDTVGYLGKGIIGVVLLDCNSLNAQTVLTRVVENINKKEFNLENGSHKKVNLSISYMQIDSKYDRDVIYNTCIEDVIDVQSAGGNMIHAV